MEGDRLTKSQLSPNLSQLAEQMGGGMDCAHICNHSVESFTYWSGQVVNQNLCNLPSTK
jgi:hypothetical protein